MPLVHERRDVPHQLPAGGLEARSTLAWIGHERVRPPDVDVIRAPKCGIARPRRRKSSVPLMPTGTIGTPARVARSAAPGSGFPDAREAACPLRKDDQGLACVEELLAQPVGLGVAAAGPDRMRPATAGSGRPRQRRAAPSRGSAVGGPSAGAIQPAIERRIRVADVVRCDDQRPVVGQISDRRRSR